MDQSLLKTSWKQRVGIMLIAILLVGSMIATYIGIVLSGTKSDNIELTAEQQERLTEIENAYAAKQTEMNELATELSSKYFSELSSFRSRIKAYNANSANSNGLQKTDLKQGSGKELAEDDTNYYAYFFGWCPDGSTPSSMSSFDDPDSPTSLGAPIYAGQGMIAGWNSGVVGMKLGGIREITIPGELAYGDTRDDICDGANSPLKFVVMPLAEDKLYELESELETLYNQAMAIYYGN